MGLLDDAIREHLELKRRHGADPDEVSRQEEEVLGAAQEAAEFARSEEEPPAEVGPEPEAPVDEIEPPPEPEDAPAGADEDPWIAEDRDEVPAGETLERPAAPPQRAPDPEPEPEPQEGEDVLEETPEFLQETPEHERLWFEQRPPRDFDWDK
jgi:hypothetical protein